MRDIKFRCYDDVNKQMITDKDINVLLKNINNNKSHIYQQYTGLKDKNGVEIYEGDIVAYELGVDDEKPENYKIIFDNKQCAYFMFPLDNKSRLRHFTYSAKNDSAVIGNIYEHGYLLDSNS